MKLPPYVHQVRQKNGRLRWYFRRKGLASVPLPDPREKAAFAQVYARALREVKAEPTNTLRALIRQYEGSPEYRALKPNSQATYRSVFKNLWARPAADSRLSTFQRKHILELRDLIAKTSPSTANLMVRVLGTLFRYALDRGLIEQSPVYKVKLLKLGEHRAWTDEELAQFETRWPRGTTQRRVYELALHTGQRRGDVARMTWADVVDGGVHVTQEKTGSKLWIPLHSSLQAELALVEDKHHVILATSTGRAFGSAYLGAFFAKAIEDAGLPEDCVTHGLRKTAARRLAEAGATDHEITSITGHMSAGMVTHYTKGADQRKLATAAILKLVRKPNS